MKRFEMWKWFKLPVDCSLVINEFNTDSERHHTDSVSIVGSYALISHHVEKVEIAINSYDQHIELIAKQAEQIKMLREALSNLASISHENEERLADRMYKDFKESDELLMAHKALSATEQK